MSTKARSLAGRGGLLAVVVVSYNRRELLLECCRSVCAAAPQARLIVVDNASSDGSAEAVRQAIPQARVIDAGANLGFARAINLGAAAASSESLLLLNSDTRIEAPAIAALCSAIDADPQVAGAGPRLRGDQGALELSVGRTMGLLNEAWFKILGTLHRNGRGVATGWLERRYARRRTTGSLSAACLLLRRKAFDQAGGMDERFFLYAEDVDLCLRLSGLGWRFLYVPEATVHHVRGASSELDAGATEHAYRASQLAFYRKHHSAAHVIVLRLYLAAQYSVAVVVSRGCTRDRARAMLNWCLHPD